MTARKQVLAGGGGAEQGKLRLVEGSSEWVRGHSLQTVLYGRSMSADSIEQMFQPAQAWVAFLRHAATQRGGSLYLAGSHVDCTWPNAYVTPEGCAVIDQEWVWQEEVALSVVVIRTIHTFLTRVNPSGGLSKALDGISWQAAIERIAKAIGVELKPEDFSAFVVLESDLQSLVFGVDGATLARRFQAQLASTFRPRVAGHKERKARRLVRRAKEKLKAVFGAGLAAS